jgi:predicted mannosyl-3-phosphoglycerate phosphatase (HAD superfamily)
MTQGNFGKNKPLWAASRGHGPASADIAPVVERRSGWGDFTPGNGRVQCDVIARTTGKRCGNDALHGSSRCRMHGGAGQAMANAPAGTISTTRGRSIVRKALAALGAGDMPRDIPVVPVSPVDRGVLVEAHANRLMSPRMFQLALTARTTPKQSRERKQRK